ncbi:PilZ domain-containing protein [Magnetococcus sp. PR-3]|uniref:PilZ domain-containing protein n=1 Tax=Magnetococcus sp. PR-3 TaxID=3120355 RepID=UPI002FCE3429
MSEPNQKKLTILGQYGQLVVRLFDGVTEVDAPIRLLTTTSGYERLSDEESEAFFQMVSPQLLKDLTDTIRALRHHLLQEWANHSSDRHDAGPFAQAYHNFENAVRQNDEDALADNPFYDLAKLIYRLHLQALQNNFQQLLVSSEGAPDFEMPVVRSFKQIWSKGLTPEPLWRKLWHSVRRMIITSKTLLAMALFIFSTFTTSRGVNELLQMSMVEELFGSLFAGQEGEIPRAMVSWGSGVLLSSAILDYKNRIFMGMAETGKVFKGIFLTMRRNPRWFVLAFFLTFVSIFTNYDGIVTLLSKHGDLAKQAEQIQQRVELALGQRALANPDNPQSLNGLLRSLEQTAAAAIDTFHRIPEDEISGVASSRDPRKGPRYWAKHFIVFGGFSEGVNDIPTVFRNSTAGRQVNQILLESGVDMTQPVDQRIKDLLALYRDHFIHTERQVTQKLAALKALMTLDQYTPIELQRILALEHYKVNQRVAEIIKLVEENKTVYDEVASDLNLLMAERVALLQLVDKYGKAINTTYNVAVNVDVPEITSIEALKSGSIPVATHKSLAELKGFLTEKYGIAMGGLILTAILYFAISIDMADLMFFMNFSAYLGRRDKLQLNQRKERLDQWEKDLIGRLVLFYQGGQVGAILNWLPTASSIIIRYGLFKHAMREQPQLRPERKRHVFTALRLWFVGLFHTARHPHVNILNAWFYYAQKTQAGDKTMAQNLFLAFYPGISLGQGVPKQGFAHLEKIARTGISQNQEQFALEAKQAVEGPQECQGPNWRVLLRRETDGDFRRLESTLAKLQQTTDEEGNSIAGAGVGNRPSSLWQLIQAILRQLRCLWRSLFLSNFAPPIEQFSMDYTVWLKDLEQNLVDSRKINEAVSHTVPLAERVVMELPVFHATTLLPLQNQIEQSQEDWVLPYRALINYFRPMLHDLEVEAMRLLGFHSRAEKLSIEDPWLDQPDEGIIKLMYDVSEDSFPILDKFEFLTGQIKEAQESIELIGQRVTRQKGLIQDIRESEQRFSHLTMRVRMRSYGQPMTGHQQATNLIERVKHEMQLMLDTAEELVDGGQVPTEASLTSLQQIHDHMKEVEMRIDGGDPSSLDEVFNNPNYLIPDDLFPDEAPVAGETVEHPPLNDWGEPQPMSDPQPFAGQHGQLEPFATTGQGIDAAPQHPGQSSQQAPIPTQHVPSQQAPVQPIPTQHVPSQQAPVQPIPTQHVPSQQAPSQQGFAPLSPGQLPTGHYPSPQPPAEVIPAPLAPQQPPPEPAAPVVRRSRYAENRWPQQQPAQRVQPTPSDTMAMPQVRTSVASPALPGAQVPPAEPPPLVVELSKTRRRGERVQHASKVEFVNENGWIYRGLTEDISVTGVRVMMKDPLDGIHSGETGAFFLMEHSNERGFPCQIVRVDGGQLVLNITGDLSRYSLLVMQGAFSHFNFSNRG